MKHRLSTVTSAAAALCLFALSTGGVAHAGVTDDLARWLDRDTPIVIRTEPLQLQRATERAIWLGIPEAARARDLSRVLGQSGLGADLLTRRGWHDAGFDASAPILMGLAAINAPAMTSAINAARRGRLVAPPIWRNRIVMRVRDPGRVDSLVKRVARLMPMLSGVSTVETPLIARLLKASVMQSLRLAAELKRRGVLAVGYIDPLQSYVFVFRRGNTLIVDVLGTFNGVRPTWTRMRSRMLSVLDRGAGRFSRRLSSGAATMLRAPGTAVWIDAVRLYDAVDAFRKLNILSMFFAGVLGNRIPSPTATCASFRRVARAGPFKDMAVRSMIRTRSIELETAWGMRTLFKMSAPFIIQNDQLPLPKVGPRGPVATGALFVRGLGALRAVPRPAALQSSFWQTWRDAARCGRAATSTLGLFGWPQLLGLFMNDLAKINSSARTLVDGTRNAVLSLRKYSSQLKGLELTVAASGTKPAMNAARRMVRTLFGRPTTHRRKGGPIATPITTWGSGPMRPFSFRTVLGRDALGLSLPASGVARYLGARPAPAHGARGIIGTINADLTRLLPDLVPGYAGRHLGTKLRRLTGTLEVMPETIVLSTHIGFAP